MASISVYQARAELSQLIERALSGEEIVVTRRGRPTVRLLPVEQAMPQRKPGGLKGLLEVSDSFFEPLPEDVLEAFYNGSVEPRKKLHPHQTVPSGGETAGRYPRAAVVGARRSAAFPARPRRDPG